MKKISDVAITREGIKVEGELVNHELNLELIKQRVGGELTINDLLLDTLVLSRVKQEIELARNEFKEKVESYDQKFQQRIDELDEVIDDIKVKAIKQAEDTMTYKTKYKKVVDPETGEISQTVEKKAVHTLPKGFTYKRGTDKWEYKEDSIPEQFFKKTLKKTEVKKAIQAGELPFDLVDITPGNPSVSITPLAIEKLLIEQEKKEGE